MIGSTLENVLLRIRELTPAAQIAPTQVSPAATSNGSGTSFESALGLATGGSGSSATGASSLPAAAAPYASTIEAAATKYGLDPKLLASVIQQESGFNPNATSAAGAQGLMQLMPSTAASLGVTDAYDPAQSIDGGARYLRNALDQFGGNTSLALAAYNAGAGAVTRYGGVPPYAETQGYVKNILAHYQELVNGRNAA